MSRRLVKKNARPYHGFPWSRAAMVSALMMYSRVLSTGPRVTLRTIADDLHARGLVEHKPDPATVRRMLESDAARQLERELALKGTHGKGGLRDLESVGCDGCRQDPAGHADNEGNCCNCGRMLTQPKGGKC